MSSNIKDRVLIAIDNSKDTLVELSHRIHAQPELAFHEQKTAALLCSFLEERNFKVTRGYGGLETAFYAEARGKAERPKVAFLAEYDALKGIGHGCGHNIIATCAVGAFIGAAAAVTEQDGSVCIIGTPAEEGGGGKVIMLENGAFDGVDFALMIHPTAGKSMIGRGGRAAVVVTVSFRGRNAHSSDPSKGINALNALLNLFAAIDMMRPSMPLGANVNGIVTHGGEAANIIPGYSCGEFSVRAHTLHDLKNIVKIIRQCVESSEKLTGTKAEMEIGRYYGERYPNRPLGEAFKANMALLGEEMFYPTPNMQYGSSDIGNVSIKLPAIHEYLSIAQAGINAHSADFAEAALSPRADQVCILGAKGLAMTAMDVLTNAKLRQEALESHEKQIPDIYKHES